jgi:hypothetical protein
METREESIQFASFTLYCYIRLLVLNSSLQRSMQSISLPSSILLPIFPSQPSKWVSHAPQKTVQPHPQSTTIVPTS